MIEKFVCVDVEMPNGNGNRISAIGISVFEHGTLTKQMYSLINPETWFQPYVVELIGITPEMVETAPTFPEYWAQVQPVLQDALFVAHGAGNDLKALSCCLRHYKIDHPATVRYLCTVDACTACYPERQTYSLDSLCEAFSIPLEHHHARSDSEACGRLLLQCLQDGLDAASLIRTFDLNAGHNQRAKQPSKKKRAAMSPSVRIASELTLMLKPTQRPQKGAPLPTLSESFLQTYVQQNRSHEYLYRFIKELPHETENGNNLHAVVLSGRSNFSAMVRDINVFLPYVRSTQTVECLRPRIFQKRQPELAKWLRRWMLSDEPMTVLFALQTLRRYYLKTPQLSMLLDIACHLHTQDPRVEDEILALLTAAAVKNLSGAQAFLQKNNTDARVQQAIDRALEKQTLQPQKREKLQAFRQ